MKDAELYCGEYAGETAADIVAILYVHCGAFLEGIRKGCREAAGVGRVTKGYHARAGKDAGRRRDRCADPEVANRADG